MLKQRILTAVVLAPLILGAIYFLSTPVVAAIIALIILLGAWEWAGLSGMQGILSKAIYTGIAAVLMFVCYPLTTKTSINLFLVVACSWWFIALVIVIFLQKTGSLPKQNQWLSLLIGILILLPAWMSILYLHGLGSGWVLFLLALIWTADIGAYFAGRALGRHKLADKLSPGKSWEGVIGGLAAVLVITLFLLPRLTGPDNVSIGMLLLCIATALISVLGDLTESVVKRISGKKDSGNILPGHGGVMDRIDSLTAAAPIFAAGLVLFGYLA